jgi:enterochelin esterase-like enzyme
MARCVRNDRLRAHFCQPEAVNSTHNSHSLSGTLTGETFAYDGGRRVTAYVPQDRPTGVVFAADGLGVPQWGAALEASGVTSTAIVGVHGLSDERGRLEEYSPEFNADRFAAHEAFFVDEVRSWAAERFQLGLSAARTAVFGASAGGELAIALGIRHPDVYGAVLSGSPGGGYQPPEILPESLPRTYLVAGTQEPFFLVNAIRWADALVAAGADVVLKERDAGHGSTMWRDELPLMVAWAFG